MKILMLTDLDGVSGVVSAKDQAGADGKYTEAAKKLLTGEINAAVEGLLAKGVSEILVFDGHGWGAVCFENLHPAARLLHGRPVPWMVLREEIFPRYDAVVVIGQHARAGTARGSLSHTGTDLIESLRLNGREIGEIAQFALYVGALGLPVIFLAGDDAAAREAEEFIPGITTAAVKQGLSFDSAISWPPAAAQALIKEGIQIAIDRHRAHPIAPLRWPGPYVLEKRWINAELAQSLLGPGSPYERVDAQTVRFRHENILDCIYM